VAAGRAEAVKIVPHRSSSCRRVAGAERGAGETDDCARLARGPADVGDRTPRARTGRATRRPRGLGEFITITVGAASAAGSETGCNGSKTRVTGDGVGLRCTPGSSRRRGAAGPCATKGRAAWRPLAGRWVGAVGRTPTPS